MGTIRLRDACEEDLPLIHLIEEEVYPVPWTPNFFRIIYHMNEDLFIVAVEDERIIGYTVGEIEIMGRKDAPRKAGHVLNIAVRSEYQGRGVGTMLLDEVEMRFMRKGSNIAYLEVRESNENAQKIYSHRGYLYVRTAENYYGDEDGYIMSKKLDN
ncbi:MAG: ribosomal protein S18-alanine N-acetyltransferase [Candidatus Bathyarchaeota archaeon]|nr:ribosomal protein S18-alanine N-acetyltransferase [Candidatus Bathyarchaeota archaeon]